MYGLPHKSPILNSFKKYVCNDSTKLEKGKDSDEYILTAK